MSPDDISATKVGRVFGKMRLEKPSTSERPRPWYVTESDLIHWATAYGIDLPGNLDPNKHTGTSGIDGTSGTSDDDIDPDDVLYEVFEL